MISAKISDTFLRKLDALEYGQMTLKTPDGKTRIFSGSNPGPSAILAVRDWRVIGNLAINGDIGFAEDYRDGLWDTQNLQDLLSLALVNEKAVDAFIFGSLPARALARFSNLLRLNTLRGSRRNISAHYDLGNDFYRLWLDSSMTYSSAIFSGGGQGLFQAQQGKYDRLIEGLGKNSGSVLEIGCGWGGFAARALERGDYAVKGITLSARQKEYADGHLRGRATVALEDYRHQEGSYDGIISIEMFEAVGQQYWKAYFDKIASLLKKGGTAMIQTITIADDRFARYRQSGDFIRKFIFPGGMLPSPERFTASAAASGLRVTDRLDFGQDYARTLQMWLDSFDDVRPQVASLGYDERFIRMWRFYLAACIAGFRTGRTDVMQIGLSHA
jgi:cyclopropane-fatty-acyl-phospholipid synthase